MYNFLCIYFVDHTAQEFPGTPARMMVQSRTKFGQSEKLLFCSSWWGQHSFSGQKLAYFRTVLVNPLWAQAALQTHGGWPFSLWGEAALQWSSMVMTRFRGFLNTFPKQVVHSSTSSHASLIHLSEAVCLTNGSAPRVSSGYDDGIDWFGFFCALLGVIPTAMEVTQADRSSKAGEPNLWLSLKYWENWNSKKTKTWGTSKLAYREKKCLKNDARNSRFPSQTSVKRPMEINYNKKN